jgi:hypothetical protein
MVVTLKQFEKAGKLADERAQKFAKRHGVPYSEALAVVLKNDAKLRKAYHRSPPREPLKALDELAAYLNEEAKHAVGEASALYEILVPLKHMDATDPEREAARARLEQQFSRVAISCVPLLSGHALRLGLHYPTGHLGTVIRALHEGTFSSLHCCRWCKKFFVDEDHRATYCSEACSKTRATHRVKVWRAERRKEEADIE